MKGLLLSVIRTLNLVEVRGKENMGMLSGCIQVLENLCEKAVETTEAKEEPVNADQNEQRPEVCG